MRMHPRPDPTEPDDADAWAEHAGSSRSWLSVSLLLAVLAGVAASILGVVAMHRDALPW